MLIAITVIHVIVSLGLILVVLLQTGKGAEIGAVFGGSSSTVFGSSGAGTFLTKVTTGMAIVFMLTSLTLGYFAGHRPSATIFDTRSPAVEPRTTAPAAPSATRDHAPATTPQPEKPARSPDQQSQPKAQ